MKLIDGALPYGDYKLEAAKAGLDLSSNEGRIDYVKRASKIISTMSPVERDIYISKAAKEAGVSESAVRMELSPEGESIAGGPLKPADRGRDHEEKASDEPDVIMGRDRDLLALAMRRERYIDTISTMTEIFAMETSARIFEAIERDYREHGELDEHRVMDSLSDSDRGLLREACESTPYYEDEEKVFRDCMRDWKLSALVAEEEKIITMLSLADESDDDDKLKTLMERLKIIQTDIQKERNLG